MFRLHKKSEYKEMPWKNGQGITAEIAISPASAKFPADAFDWRLSSAMVLSANAFSNFNGCQRLLTVVEGHGLTLNGEKLLPSQITQFSGEEKVECDLIQGACVDLGLIYRADQVKAEMQTQNLSAGKKNLILNKGRHFVFCVEGEFSVLQTTAEKGDCLEIEDVPQVGLNVATETKFVLVSVYDL